MAYLGLVLRDHYETAHEAFEGLSPRRDPIVKEAAASAAERGAADAV
jgi:hypothetical protein